MLNSALISIGMCLLGGEQVDISKYILPTASLIQLKVVLKPAGGELIIYSPGYEDKKAQFSEAESFATIPIAGSILCVKATGGPFDFNVQVVPQRSRAILIPMTFHASF
jgi:hypothetical protein